MNDCSLVTAADREHARVTVDAFHQSRQHLAGAEFIDRRRTPAPDDVHAPRKQRAALSLRLAEASVSRSPMNCHSAEANARDFSGIHQAAQRGIG